MSTRESKIAMYKALRSVKEKMDKGQLTVFDKNDRPDFKESMFLVQRVVGAILLAEMDADIVDTKINLDQSKGSVL